MQDMYVYIYIYIYTYIYIYIYISSTVGRPLKGDFSAPDLWPRVEGLGVQGSKYGFLNRDLIESVYIPGSSLDPILLLLDAKAFPCRIGTLQLLSS